MGYEREGEWREEEEKEEEKDKGRGGYERRRWKMERKG